MIYTIPQKQSGTGTIHDIASQHYDREIKFPKGAKFAVVLAAYCGHHYTTHRTQRTAIAKSRRETSSHKIIDVRGINYEIQGDVLVPCWDA